MSGKEQAAAKAKAPTQSTWAVEAWGLGQPWVWGWKEPGKESRSNAASVEPKARWMAKGILEHAIDLQEHSSLSTST